MEINNEYSFLEALGLHKNEVKIYLEGLAIGKQATSVFARKVGLPRSSVQVYLANLSKRGIMIRSIHKGVQYYTSIAPEELGEVIAHEKQRVAQMEASFSSVLELLQTHYKTEFSLPNMTTYEGVQGLEKIYDLILQEQKEVYFFRSPFYTYEGLITPERRAHFAWMLKEGSIPVRGLTHGYRKYSTAYIMERDAFFGIARRFSPIDIFQTPSQLILFGDYVATITAEGQLSSILMRNGALATMLKNVFMCVWELSLPYHEELLKKDDPQNYEKRYRHFDEKDWNE